MGCQAKVEIGSRPSGVIVLRSGKVWMLVGKNENRFPKIFYVI
jgi:hypothetical protein